MEEKEIPYLKNEAIAYTDGSYDVDTKEFSCGVVLFYDRKMYCYHKKNGDPDLRDMRNVAGEILGAGYAIQWCLKNQVPKLCIFHDYEGVEKWATGAWKAKKNGTKRYRDLCVSVADRLTLRFVKVQGHSGDYWNEKADALAKEALGK